MKTKRKILVTILLSFVSIVLPAQKKSFEGEFHLTNTVTADKTFRKLYTWIVNGEYRMDIIRRGEDELCAETYQGTTTLILRSQNIVYCWSTLLKKGVKFAYIPYEDYLKSLHKDFTSTVKATGETREIFGYICNRYRGAEKATTNVFGAQMTTTQEEDYWVCEDYPAEYLGSTYLPGMPFYYEENSRVGLPLLGEGSQHQSISVTSIKERSVADNELTPPADIQFTTTDDGYNAMQKLAKEIRKYKKKHNITDDGVKTEGVGQQQGEWDF